MEAPSAPKRRELLILSDPGGRRSGLHHRQDGVLVGEEGLEDGALQLAAACNGHFHGVDRPVVEAMVQRDRV